MICGGYRENDTRSDPEVGHDVEAWRSRHGARGGSPSDPSDVEYASHAGRHPGRHARAIRRRLFLPQQKEFWLSTDEFDYIRPGLSDHGQQHHVRRGPPSRRRRDLHRRPRRAARPRRRPDAGRDLHELHPRVVGPEHAQLHLVHTRIADERSTESSATQASADSGGTWTRHRHRPLDLHLQDRPARRATTRRRRRRSGIYATRDTSDILGKDYYANVEHDFVPTGAPVTQTWDVSDQRRLQHLPRPALRARRLAPGRQALRPLPLAPDDRPRHGQHASTSRS